jgi:hypothetical protein
MTSKAKLVLIAAIAAVLLASPALALTQQVSYLICSSGYSLIGQFCISDKTGDIVLPTTYKWAGNSICRMEAMPSDDTNYAELSGDFGWSPCCCQHSEGRRDNEHGVEYDNQRSCHIAK